MDDDVRQAGEALESFLDHERQAKVKGDGKGELLTAFTGLAEQLMRDAEAMKKQERGDAVRSVLKAAERWFIWHTQRKCEQDVPEYYLAKAVLAYHKMLED